mmetsp:Transcript_90350/g.255856  ORF Transcript_90350/g.255856 Transcript_90350/m.255856 type:complete len:1020 (+) Transcript_90350:208-3267(+)
MRHSVSTPWEALRSDIRLRRGSEGSAYPEDGAGRRRASRVSSAASAELGQASSGTAGGNRASTRRSSISSLASDQSGSALQDSQQQYLASSANSASSRASSWGDTCIVAMRNLVQSSTFSIAMFVLTVYVLFGDDLRLAFFRKGADPVFNIITIVSIFLFSVELVLTSIAIDDYFLSFFFCLDIVSTVSLILDLTFVWEYLVGYESIASSQETAREDAADQSDYARAGRSSRVGTRVARMLRVLRLIRMARMFKIVSAQKQKRRNSQRALSLGTGFGVRPGQESQVLQGNAEDDTNNESRVGKKLSEKTTLWVIVLVLAMLVIVPLLDPGDNEAMMDDSAQYGADVIHEAWYDFVSTGSNQRRINWETQVLMYTYYHNYYATCPDKQGEKGDCASDTLYKLCFLGYFLDSQGGGNTTDPYIRELNSADWDSLFLGRAADWKSTGYIVGLLPEDIKQRLARPWTTNCEADTTTIYGVSLIREDPCPWRIFRPQETITYSPTFRRLSQALTGTSVQLLLVFDISAYSKAEAVMSMIRTVFVIMALAGAALMFSTDADNLVLHPIERMIMKVDLIRKNPLYAIKLGDEQYREELGEDTLYHSTKTIRTSLSNLSHALWSSCWGSRKPARQGRKQRLKKGTSIKKVSLETKILENTIIKLGSLLALGFGEAGSEIIGHNLDDDNKGVDAMIPGRKVEAIYGYCQIKDFNITTEVLQEKTMVFVNQVAEIVHNIVDTWHGAANRNIGDAFLIVWRVREDFSPSVRTKMGDMSVISFVQVVAAINKSAVLKDYREHPALLARLPNYRVRMGFGLHYGWAIEGAIGSEFKIDASYLSPHVNMASRLETVTKQYQVLILMSEPLAQLCSPEMVRYFRTIDRVTLKGGMSTPIRLHTVDLSGESLKTDYVVPKRGNNQFELRMQREKAKEEKLQEAFKIHALFERDPDLKKMRKEYPVRFFQLFSKGYLNYEAGEWDVARSVFEQTRDMLGWGDGPSKALLDYMALFQYESFRVTPKGWPRYRELIET